MAGAKAKLAIVLALEVFQRLASGTVKIAELNAATAILINANIPFDMSFQAGTPRDLPEATLTVFINPQTQVSFTFFFSI